MPIPGKQIDVVRFGRRIFACLLLSICLVRFCYGTGPAFSVKQLGLPNEFSANTIVTVYEDKAGLIWMLSANNGLFRFDGNEIISSARLFPNLREKTNISRIHIDTRNNLWLAGAGWISRIDLGTYNEYSYEISSGTTPAVITAFGNDVYYSTPEGRIYHIDAHYRQEKIVDVSGKRKNVYQPHIHSIVFFESALYFTVAYEGIYKWTPDGKISKLTAEGGEDISHINCTWMETGGDAIYAQGNFDGLVCIQHGRAKMILKGEIGPRSNCYPVGGGYFADFGLAKTTIVKLHRDHLVSVDAFPFKSTVPRPWKQQGGGLYFRGNETICRLSKTVAPLFENDRAYRSLNERRVSIRSILRDGDDLLLGTYDGLYRLNGDAGAVRKLDNELVYSMIRQGGHTFLGTEGGGLMTLNGQALTSVISRESIENPFITALALNGEDTLLMGTYQGMYVYNLRSGTLKLLKHEAGPREAYFSRVRKIIPRGNIVYYATDKGMFYSNKANLRQARTLKNFPDGVTVFDFCFDSPYIWMASRNRGLIRYNTEAADVRYFTRAQGLAGNTIFSLWLHEGYLICGTNNGLSVLNGKDGSVQNFYKSDGLPSNEFNHGALLADDGRLYMGTVNGLVSFQFENLLSFHREPPAAPVISSLIVGSASGKGQRELFNLPYDTQKYLRLRSDERFLSFHFSSLGKVGPSTLYYRINDQQYWLKVNSNSIALAGLNPGVNRIALSEDQRRTAGEITVEVAPYFYETWWFRAALALLFMCIPFAVIRYRIGRIRRDQALRTRISSDLHDELGGMLTGISMQADYLLYSTKKLDVTSRLQKISAASKEATGVMSDMVWSIDARNDDWHSLIGRMRTYANAMFEPCEIKMQFAVSGKHRIQLKQFIRQNLYLIFKEAVNNICKHAQATKVQISLEIREDKVKLRMKDNGRGLVPMQKIQGQGIANMRMRAKRLQGQLVLNEGGDGLELELEVTL